MLEEPKVRVTINRGPRLAHLLLGTGGVVSSEPGRWAVGSIAEAAWWEQALHRDGLAPWQRLGQSWGCHLETGRKGGREKEILASPPLSFLSPASLSH